MLLCCLQDKGEEIFLWYPSFEGGGGGEVTEKILGLK
jgi:hypothetical protein